MLCLGTLSTVHIEPNPQCFVFKILIKRLCSSDFFLVNFWDQLSDMVMSVQNMQFKIYKNVMTQEGQYLFYSSEVLTTLWIITRYCLLEYKGPYS